MQKIEIEFLDEYKKLDKLCQDMYAASQGVTEYINRMEVLSNEGRYLIDKWNTDYYTLKHLRWLRNTIVHNLEETDCSLEDLQSLKEFYQQILNRKDSLALLYMMKQKLSTKEKLSIHQDKQILENVRYKKQNRRNLFNITIVLIIAVLVMIVLNFKIF